MPLSGGPYGVTQTGFLAPSMAVILSAIEADLQAAFGASIDLNPQSNFGQIAGVVADRVLDLWNLGEAVYTAQTSEGAVGVAEDAINGLTGCIRKAATASTVGLALTGTNATIVPQGSIVAVTGPNSPQFATTAAATLATATAWAAGAVHAIGDYVTNTTQNWAQSTPYPAAAYAVANGNLYFTAGGGTSASTGSGPSGTAPATDGTVTWAYVSASLGASIYYCSAPGTAGVALSGGPSGIGPTGQNSAIPDGTGGLTWLWAGTGAAMATVTANGTITGPLAGPAGTVTVIVTPVAGWSGVWNPFAAIQGANIETDSAYRLRRDNTLGNEGEAYLNAIQAAVAATSATYLGQTYGVAACTVFENTSDQTGVGGNIANMPPHSVECLVSPAAALTGAPTGAVTAWQNAVAAAIFKTLPAGIQPFGQTNTVTVVLQDSAGNPQTIQFSEPNPITINVAIAVTVNPSSPLYTTVANAQAAIQAAIISAISILPAGFNVDASYVQAQAFVAGVGAWQVTSCTVNGGSIVNIGPRQYPVATLTSVPTSSITVTPTVP